MPPLTTHPQDLGPGQPPPPHNDPPPRHSLGLYSAGGGRRWPREAKVGAGPRPRDGAVRTATRRSRWCRSLGMGSAPSWSAQGDGGACAQTDAQRLRASVWGRGGRGQGCSEEKRKENEKGVVTPTELNLHRGALCFMVNTWARHKPTEAELRSGWRLAVVGGGWRLAVGGGWPLAVGVGWRLSIRGVLDRNKMRVLGAALCTIRIVAGAGQL